MKSFFYICTCLFLLGAPLTSAQAQVSQTFAIENVREIHAHQSVQLHIRQSTSESLKAEGSTESLQYLKVNLDDGRLTISHKQPAKGFWGWIGLNSESGEDITVYIQVKDLSLINLSGASYAKLDNLQSKQLKVQLSGASKMDGQALHLERLHADLSGASRMNLLTVDAQHLQADVSGASQIEIEQGGQANSLTAEVSGASKFFGRQLQTHTAKVSASGASHAEVRASDNLDANANGASHINYYGTPKVQQHTSGASSIRHQGE